MTLRVAFDLDGVLADMESALVREAEAMFGARLRRRSRKQQHAMSGPPSPGSQAAREKARDEASPAAEPIALPVARLDLTARQHSRLWRHVTAIEGFWESLNEIEPGLVAQLWTLATTRRWEVIFLTKRPDSVGATAQVQSQRWLEARGFNLPSVYVVQRSRGRIAEALALDVVVDDRPENCLDVVADSHARAVLVWREDEKLLPAATRRLGIGVVESAAESLSILTRLDSSPPDRSGVVDRVMRLLRRKEPASV